MGAQREQRVSELLLAVASFSWQSCSLDVLLTNPLLEPES